VAGLGSLPGLNAAVPWDRPGAVPWGDDGRFDLLLLGSDASGGRWSRRMDVMLLVEIDVATGKVAMIGLPRNLVNAPFPAGPARNAVACGCFRDLLNALYVEATARPMGSYNAQLILRDLTNGANIALDETITTIGREPELLRERG